MIRPLVLAGLLAGLARPASAECSSADIPKCAGQTPQACAQQTQAYVADCRAYHDYLERAANNNPGAQREKQAQQQLAAARIQAAETGLNEYRAAYAREVHNEVHVAPTSLVNPQDFLGDWQQLGGLLDEANRKGKTTSDEDRAGPLKQPPASGPGFQGEVTKGLGNTTGAGGQKPAAVDDTPADSGPSVASLRPQQRFFSYFSSGDLDGAESVLLEEQRRSPKDAAIPSLLSRVRMRRGDSAGAREAALQAAKLDPEEPFAKMVLGQGDRLAAGQARIGAMKIGFDQNAGPGEAAGVGGLDAETQAKLAAAGAVPGAAATPVQREGAERALASIAAGVAPQAEPRSQAQALLQRAVQRIAVGDPSGPEGAIFQISRALMLDPQNVAARILRAHVSNLPKVHNYQAAIEDAKKALELEPKSAAALFEKGYAELQLGKLNEALHSVEDGLALEPNNAMGRLYHAMILEKANLVGKAVDEYRTAASLDLSLKPVVDEALGRIAGASQPAPERLVAASPRATVLPRSVPTKPILWALLLISALALILEGGKRVFYKDWQTQIAPSSPRSPIPATIPSGLKGTLAPGAMLGNNFRIERELARGGIGIVYEATDVTLKRPVAIKHLNRQAYESDEVRARFVKEAQLAARLRHQNLAQIYSVVNDDELYLVFELVEGEALSTSLQKRMRLPLAEVKSIVADVASALDYAHSQRIIHRDLKPANIMRTPDGASKVMDFGIAHEARSMTDQTQTQAWGTPPYMAPEQEMGRVSKESDYYALGVMIYELLSGRRPFEGPSALERKLRGEFPPIEQINADLPEGLRSFFTRVLNPDPAKRFSSAAELSRALDAVDATPVRA